MFIYLVKSRVFMHLWATDFRVFTVGRRTPSQHFYGLSPPVIMSNRNYRVFHPMWYLSLLAMPNTHIFHFFFLLCDHETHFGRCPITELTTHSPRMMNDHNHAHNVPVQMQCKNANACTSCYMYNECYMDNTIHTTYRCHGQSHHLHMTSINHFIHVNLSCKHIPTFTINMSFYDQAMTPTQASHVMTIAHNNSSYVNTLEYSY